MIPPRQWKQWSVVFLLALVLTGTGSGTVNAQNSKGTVSGRIVDSLGGVLQGARIRLEPGPMLATSDAQGEFAISGVEAGTYSITISYVGLENYSGVLEVKSGNLVRADAVLKVGAQAESVIVTAERAAGEAEAVNRERSADNIVQILPADVIRSLPNANLADALGRLPSVTLERDEGEGKYVQVRGTEPRLTNTTIDGMNVPSPESGVRQIKFDAIPADLVESVEINKTLQANMDADGIGGSVNLVTKTASERPTVSLNGMGGYMPILGGRGQVETTGTVGQRFGAQKKFGVLIGGSYDWTGRGIDDIEPVSDVATLPGGATQQYYESIDEREYRYYRSRWGLAGSGDYKLGDGSNIYIRGLYSDFKNYGDRWVYSLTDNTPIQSPITPNGISLLDSNGCGYDPTDDPNHVVCGGTPEFSVQTRRPDIAIGSILIGGKHNLTSTWFSWDVSAGRSRDNNVSPGQAKFAATGLTDNVSTDPNVISTSACQFSPSGTSNILRPQWTPACFSEAFNQSNYTLDNIQTDHGRTAQLNLQFAGAMGKRYHLGSHVSTIEIGGRFRNAHKFDDTFSIELDPNTDIPFSQFPSEFSNSNYYGGSYQLGPNPTYQTINKFVLANPSLFDSTSSLGIDPANYDLVEKVSAGYVMNTVDLNNRLRLVAGVRFEGTNLKTVSFDTTTSTLTDEANGSYLKVLPSASLRIALTNDTNLRLVYGRGLSRPDPQDIAQAVTFTTGGNPNTAALGNPSLKAETADNFDVLVEHYLNPFGMISGGFFYKRLTDPIVTRTFVLDNFQPSPIAPPGSYKVTQPVNAGSAWIAGFEASYLQHLSFLPGKWGGLGISANYGYTDSRASGLSGRSDHPRLLRNAPNTWNISPTYDRGRFSIRVGLSYNQANIASYSFQDGTGGSDATPGGLKGPFGDVYFYSHLQVDAQGSVRLGKGLSFIAYGLNLTNEVFGFYQGSSQFMIQREYYQPTYAAGFRWNPSFEKR
ncbi:MAG TPA: TonB-dependent receptor [Candidatus Eisenbacteria bacterium]|jgi:TonB-dependent receptor|nr:TonB-dependent receptor [Candidatus Eisenbacteria bacterium]